MTQVYDLWFERDYPDRESTELHIGIYATEADAIDAISQLSDRPGFRDYPDDFTIHPTILGATGWREGFITEFVPAKERNAIDLPAWI
jgi:hypothetical protein